MFKIIPFLISLSFSLDALAQDQIIVCGNKSKVTYKLSEKKLYKRHKGKWIEDCKPENDRYRYEKDLDGSQYYKLDVYDNSAVCIIKRHIKFRLTDKAITLKPAHTSVIDFLLLNVSYEYTLNDKLE